MNVPNMELKHTNLEEGESAIVSLHALNEMIKT